MIVRCEQGGGRIDLFVSETAEVTRSAAQKLIYYCRFSLYRIAQIYHGN